MSLLKLLEGGDIEEACGYLLSLEDNKQKEEIKIIGQVLVSSKLVHHLAKVISFH